MTTEQCTCGAVNFEGAKHQEGCPVPNPQSTGRRTLEDPGSSFIRIRFIEGKSVPMVDSYQPDGSPAEILAGKLQCLLIGTRLVDTVHGPGMVADVAFTEPVDLTGLEASFFCSSMLSRLIAQVEPGALIEITRLADKATKGGRAHQYQVDVLDGSTPATAPAGASQGLMPGTGAEH